MAGRDREYAPGSRSQRFRKIHKGEYVKERIAWVNTLVGMITLYFYDEGSDIAESTSEPGPTVKIIIPRSRGAAVHWDISALTLEELDKMREFFTLAFDTAEPVVRMRDEVAKDALTEGNDSFTRIYRQVPQLVVRQRPQRQYGAGVLDGSEDVPEGDGGSSPSGGVRGIGGELADVGTQDSSGQDDGT